MVGDTMQICFIILSVLEAVFYHWKTYHFSVSILEGSSMNRAGLFLSMGANLMILAAMLFSRLPILLLFLVLYLFILLEYLFFCKGRMVTFLFTSGTFIFHIMNVHMMFFGLFSMVFEVHSVGAFHESGLNPLMIINVYLCMLGVSYSIGQNFSGLLSLFLLSTSILLYGFGSSEVCQRRVWTQRGG